MELKFFDIQKDNEIVCDANHNGLGAVLGQLEPELWRPISIASRFSMDAEKRYSTKKNGNAGGSMGCRVFSKLCLGTDFSSYYRPKNRF